MTSLELVPPPTTSLPYLQEGVASNSPVRSRAVNGALGSSSVSDDEDVPADEPPFPTLFLARLLGLVSACGGGGGGVVRAVAAPAVPVVLPTLFDARARGGLFVDGGLLAG